MALSYEDVYGVQDTKKINTAEDVGFFESALAGVATGLWNIPKGFVSLGAEIYDLVGDTDTAKSVEQWFDDVNPFDDEAEARTIGRVTQAISQIAPVAVGGALLGARAGKAAARGLAKKAIDLRSAELGVKGVERVKALSDLSIAQKLTRKAVAAKRAGKYFSLTNAGRKIMGPVSGGVIGGGIGEAIVTDEDIGTFADIARGTSLEPFAITMLDRETKEGRDEAFRRLKNRLKFGTEGALFNLALLGAGKGVQKIRTPDVKGVDEYVSGPVGKFFQKVRLGLSPQRGGTRQTLELVQQSKDAIKSLELGTLKGIEQLDTHTKELVPLMDDLYRKGFISDKKGFSETDFLNEIKSIMDTKVDPTFIGPKTETTELGSALLPNKQAKAALGRIKASKNIQQSISELPTVQKRIQDIDEQLKSFNDLSKTGDSQDALSATLGREPLIKERAQLNRRFKEIQELIKDGRTLKKNVFKYDDYVVSGQLKQLLDNAKKAGYKNTEDLKQTIINTRLSIDNVSSLLMQTGKLGKEDFDTFAQGLGNYFTEEYKRFTKLPLFAKYKVTNEVRQAAFESLKADKLKAWQLDPANSFKGKIVEPTKDQLKRIDDVIDEQITNYIKKESLDEANVLDKNFVNGVEEATGKKATKEEIKAVSLSPSILEEKVAAPWQKILLGEIKDPRYTFHATVSKQAHLLYGLKYMDEINRSLSVGPNQKIFTAEELVKKFGKEQGESLMSDPNKFRLVEPSAGKLSGMSPLEGKYIRAPEYDAIFDTSSNWLNNGNVGSMYRYMLLTPKAMAQVSKTILSPVTHVRNFMSATLFALANGAILPNISDISTLAPKVLGGKGVIGEARDLTAKRIFGTITDAERTAYRRLKGLGVVGTQPEALETIALTRDIQQGATGAKAFDKLSKLPAGVKKAYQKAQESYIAEDDFWKIVTFNLEKNRYQNILGKIGVTKENYKEILNGDSKVGKFLKRKVARPDFVNESFEGFVDELSANIVRNQVPNYEYIGATAKALRQSPFGNFIAFPLEILRTGNNIITQSIDEITSGIPELRALGLRRLFSFGTTVGGIPIVATEVFKAKNDVSTEEMNALKRFVPEWSKNSTLIPVGRDEKGYLKYIDYSYSNAYDFLIRPYMSVQNALSQSDGTNESLKQALAGGMTEGAKELLEPFASESIFAEALIDSTIRRGIGRDGKEVWSPSDDTMVKIAKGMVHVGGALTPGSLSQLRRFSESVTGKTGTYGDLYDETDELFGLFGYRTINSNPERSLNFMVTKFTNSLREDNSLFVREVLKGGRVTPKDFLSAYKYSQARRYQSLKDMYKNIEAARTLGVSENTIRTKVKRKGLKKEVFKDLMNGVFTPIRPNAFVIKRTSQINRDLNEKEKVDIPNPYIETLPQINELINNNRRKSLLDENIDFIETPESTEAIINEPVMPQASLTTAPINPSLINTKPADISPQSGLTENEEALLSNPLDKLIRQRQRNKTV
jgi:hypothetical protein